MNFLLMTVLLTSPITIDFNIYPEHADVYQTIYFSTNISAINYTWDFGDGSHGYGMETLHFYGEEGTYIVTLTVRFENGSVGRGEKEIIIGLYAPYANFTYTRQNRTAIFNSTSYDEDGYIVNWTWDFGDGSIGYGMICEHTYEVEKIYNVTLTVTDDDGLASNITKKVYIRNVPPKAEFVYEIDGREVRFFDHSHDDGKIVSWYWDFGDGTVSYEKNPIHEYERDGKYEVRLTVKDEHGESDVAIREVEIKKGGMWTLLLPFLIILIAVMVVIGWLKVDSRKKSSP